MKKKRQKPDNELDPPFNGGERGQRDEETQEHKGNVEEHGDLNDQKEGQEEKERK